MNKAKEKGGPPSLEKTSAGETVRAQKRAAAKLIVSFVKPYAPGYGAGIFFYGTQSFAFSFLISLMTSALAAAMLKGDGGGVWAAVGIFALVFAAYLALLGTMVYLYVKYGEKYTADLKKRLFRAFMRTGAEDSGHSGEGIAAINTEADLAAGLADGAAVPLISSLSSVIFSGAVIFSINWMLGLLSLLIGAGALLVQLRFSGPVARLAAGRIEAGRAGVRSLSDILSGAAALRIFNLRDRMLLSFDRENKTLMELDFRGAVITTLQNLFRTLQGWITLAGVFGIGGWLVAKGRLSLAALLMVPNMCMNFAVGMSGLGGAIAGVQSPLAAAVRVAERIRRGEGGRKKDSGAQWDGSYALRAESLSFAYSGAEENTLSDISLEIPENFLAAFAGASGSGKSTLLRALIGLYERERLPVYLGGLSYDESSLEGWRRHFAYVDQSCKLFDMTVAENIALGRPGATREEIEAAAGEALAHGFITELPLGYDSPCGQGGTALSGGQKQRIAIARAILRRAPVIVFDEAASALDAESERLVMETVYRLAKTRTVLMTTHNLRYIEGAGMIFVLKDGRIVQRGRHAGLASLPGEYARLLRAGAERGGEA